MKKMGLNELREAYLEFFRGKEHLTLNSFPLVPKNDNSLLLINAGMAPLKPYFTGVQTPPNKRMATCQKCIRTGDIENVGKTSRHGTFFEMLGNFSFGDYFKEEVIPWAWEFVTKTLDLPKDRLYVTIYLDDDEAFDIWTKSTDIDPTRIFRLGKKDNFWEIGQGPCGPCSEIHFDRGEGKILTAEEFMKAGDEDRVVEFWNLVFTQFDKDEFGNYNKLANPNIDTGMGLERIATIMQGTNSIFEVDTIKAILEEVSKLSGVEYGKDRNNDISLRVITDHIRSVTFMIGDGILPSNEGRGYVLRRLLRRAARHGRLLGINNIFLSKICEVVISNSCGAYPELKEKEEYIKKVIKLEEERFSETIDGGIQILNDYIDELIKENKNILSGEKAFKLYDTYGFPLELTEEILEEKEIRLDIEGFNKEMKEQRERARAAREESNYMGSEDTILNKLPHEIETEFVGYDKTEIESKIAAIVVNEGFSTVIMEGEEGVLITEKTPFYAEMGGQIGDVGFIIGKEGKAEVLDCKNNLAGKTLHFIKVVEGKIEKGEEVKLAVDGLRRNSIRKNHTATHMLHTALKQVLGNHVQQSGSYVDGERLRFDFNHFTALTEEEIKSIEKLVNYKIMSVLPVVTDIMTIEEAKEKGAVALFDDKYKSDVRVVSVGNFSKELCGGTHVSNTGEIGMFKIISEAGVAAGVRRIEALTGMNAIAYMEEKENTIKNLSHVLKCGEKDILNKVNAQISEMKAKDKEISELKKELASGSEEALLNNVKEINGVKLISGVVEDISGDALRDLGDKLRDKLVDGVVLLGSLNEGKVQFLAMASKGAIAKGVHSGKIIKEVAAVAGGSGGGRPDMAQAGGKLPEKIKEAIAKGEELLANLSK